MTGFDLPVTLPYVVVDVFADRAFAGNPLAVVFDADALDTAALQALAREFHLSETAFPMRLPAGADPRGSSADSARYRLRIFTPDVELPFAGHPSLGAAWAQVALGRVTPRDGTLHQLCGAGLLALSVDGDEVELTGGTPSVGGPLYPGPWLAAVALQAGDAVAGLPPRVAGTGLPFVYLPMQPDAVARAEPDLPALTTLLAATSGASSLAVLHWSPGRVHARVFAAGVGVPEDPATGSAATGLGAFAVASGLAAADGETRWEIEQGAEIGRPSRLHASVVAREGVAVQCRVRGRVVPVARGEVRVPGR